LKLEKEPTIFELQRIEEELSNSEDLANLSDPLSIYLSDIDQFKLLTREQEIELAKTVSMARESIDEKVIQLGKEARDKLIVSNLRLVVSIAKKYKFFNIPLMDLIQDGTMGLMKAVDRYQVEKGFKLSTYATWWIRQSISRSISNNSKTIRLPVYYSDMLSKVRRVKRNYINEHGIEPDIETISKITKISIDSLKTINFNILDTISLDQPIGDGNSTYNDLTIDEKNLNPDDLDKVKIMEEFIIGILEDLDEREQNIIKMKFGIRSEKKTLKEIAQHYGISKQRVGQISNKAIEKLRKIITT
jgi:RNA polymerase primary sigma factor